MPPVDSPGKISKKRPLDEFSDQLVRSGSHSNLFGSNRTDSIGSSFTRPGSQPSIFFSHTTNDQPERKKRKLVRSKSQLNLVRSNSTNDLGALIRNQDRNTAGSQPSVLRREAMLDFSSIAIFSREAFANFSKKYEDLVTSPPENRVTSLSKAGVSSELIGKKVNTLSTTRVTSGFQEQAQALLENRMIPHIIAVLEGAEEQQTLSLKLSAEDNPVNLKYKKTLMRFGTNTNNNSDARQNIAVYVRADLMKAYTAVERSISHDGGHIQCVGIQYSAGNSRYETLVVHIPNDHVRSASNTSEVYKSFQQYANSKSQEPSPIIVTAFTGDTNFRNQISANTAPSIGGHIPWKEGHIPSIEERVMVQRSLNPRSSGARSDTNFMQSVPLQEGNEHVVLQPAQLNNVLLSPNATSREGIDHTSIMHWTAHTQEIFGRNPYEAQEYYNL